MSSPLNRFKAHLSLARSTFGRMQTGGDWALRLPHPVRQNLVHFFYDGFFASASDNLIVTYLTVYLLALGATQAQIGLMSSLSSLTAAIMLIPGALLVERIGRRKDIVVASGGIGSRLMIGLIALLPFLVQGPALVTIAIAMSVTRDMFANLAFPAWMSLTGEIVPIEGRGRYFSSRNIAMAAVGVVITLLAGFILTYTPQPIGYQGTMLLALVFGLFSTISFARIKDPNPGVIRVQPQAEDEQPAAARLNRLQALRATLADLRTHPDFMVLLGTTLIWNISLNIAGPFFTIFMVQELNANADMIALTSIASILSSMFLQRKFGELNDRWGARKLQMISGLLIPVVPWLWVFVTQAWHIIPINIISGALWGAYNLASFNYLLALTPPAQRARYSSVFQITVTLSLSAGAAMGSLIVSQTGFLTVFILSGIGRLVSAALFARFSRSEKSGPAPAAV